MSTLRATLLLPLLALPLLAASCGGSKDPAALTEEGYAALQAGQWTEARASFEEALEGLEAGDPHFVRAKLGQVEAMVKLDPAAARDEFLAFARAHPSTVEAKDYAYVGGKLANDRAFDPAIDVLDAGMKAHSEHPKLKALIDNVARQAKDAGDSEAVGKLRSLGYVGG